MELPAAGATQGERIEDLQCNGLKIIVKRSGFRYGTDSILLANFVKAGRGDRIVELCSGAGAVSLLLSAKTRAGRITGIEINEPLVEMANRSAALNSIEDRVRFISGDVRRIRELMGAGTADVVVANPPYMRSGSGPESADAGAAIARHELCCGLPDVAGAAKWLLNPGGMLYVVYRPDRLVDLFCVMRENNIEPKEMYSVGKASDASVSDGSVTDASVSDATASYASATSGSASLILVCGKKCAAPGLRSYWQNLL